MTEYKKHELRTHILEQSPEMYVGSITPDAFDSFIVNNENQFIKKTITYSPALYKIFDELVVNAADHVIRMNISELEDKQLVKNIKINVDRETNTVSVYNDGDGISIEIHEETKLYNPSLIFGELLTSGNYDKDKVRLTGGLNGLGAKLAIIFSTEATVETVDHRNKKIFKQTFRDNLATKDKPSIRQSTKSPYTEIKCKIDLARFGVTSITDDIFALFKKRTYEIAALTPPNVNVFFNGNKINIKDFEKFCVNFVEGAKAFEKIW